ncbi:hypothetical protein ACFE04_016630 [Oxalis oulophora]
MGSKPQDLSLACSFLFSLLLLFPFLTSPPPPPPLLDDHEQLPSRTRTRRLDDGDYDDDDNRRRPKKKRRVGDHFNPDNDELMDHYLKKKIQGIDVQQLHQGIREVDILNYEPQQLPEESAVKTEKWYWYFFYRLENYGKRPSSGEFGKITRKLKSGKGTWKPTGKEHQAKGNHSEWTMHEYHLLPDIVPNPKQYVIVKLIRKGGMPANLSPAKNGEVINLPAKVKRRPTSSIAAVGCEDHSLAASPSNENSSQSFVVLNAEQDLNNYDLNQNGNVELEPPSQTMISDPCLVDEQGSSKDMSTSSCVVDNPQTELGGSIYGYQPIQSIPLDQELQVPHCDTNFSIDLSPITQADLDEFFGLNDYEPSPQSIHLDQELQVPLCDTNFNIDLSPFTQADLDEILGLNDCEPSPQSPKHFEQIPLPSQGWDNARHSPQLNHKI